VKTREEERRREARTRRADEEWFLHSKNEKVIKGTTDRAPFYQTSNNNKSSKARRI